MELPEKVAANILEHQLFSAEEPLVVAVSGGVDSMVLLSVLLPSSTGRLVVAHFNHGMRGEESDGDEAFVREFARERGLPFFSALAQVREAAAGSGESVEMAARRLRHAFLAQVAEENGIKKIALGHHAEDQVELFWMRMLRGVLGQGLTGMRWQNPSPANPAIQLTRPLLNISKREILSYATRTGLGYREDRSNCSLDHFRNRVRHEIIPKLEQVEPSFRENTLRAMEVLEDYQTFLQSGAEHWLEAPDINFAALPTALQREVVLSQLHKLKFAPTYDLIEKLRLTPDLRVSVATDKYVHRDRDGRLVVTQRKSLGFQEARAVVDITNPGGFEFGSIRLEWRYVSARENLPDTEYFDAAKVGTRVTLRFWGPGDRYQPIGMRESVKVQDLFTNAKIPPEERRARVLAVSESGEIFWVQGLRINEQFKIRPETRMILEWKVIPCPT